MLREYQFDYHKSRPNRFAPRMKRGTVAIVLDPDVASVFRSPESVNSLLRPVINALPDLPPGSAHWVMRDSSNSMLHSALS